MEYLYRFAFILVVSLVLYLLLCAAGGVVIALYKELRTLAQPTQ